MIMENGRFQEGKRLFDSKQYQQAIVEFTYALELEPNNPNVLYERGLSYFHMNKKSLAIVDFDRALELQPNNPFRYSSRAYIKDACGDLMGAISDYEKAIELDSEDAVAYNNLGLLQEKLGRQETAKKMYAKADELNKMPNYSSMYESQKSEDTNVVLPQSGEIQIEPMQTGKVQTKDYLGVIKAVFLSKNGWSEFVTFVRNGFKFPK